MNKLHTPLRRGLAVLLLTAAFLSQIPFALASTAPRGDYPAEATRVHVVLLGYTPANDFGNACRKDIVAFETVIREGLGEKSDRVVTHDLSVKNRKTESEYTGADIEQYLKAMEVGRNDIVVVYHSGHGHIRDRKMPEASQVLAINGGDVVRGDITRILRDKTPRGLIILTDCCSSFAASDELEFVSLETPPAVNAETIQNLFLRLIGTVSLSAAEDGTSGLAVYSGPNPAYAGSAFTVALLRLTFTERTFTSWKDFFPSLSDETFQASSNLYPNMPHRARHFLIEEAR